MSKITEHFSWEEFTCHNGELVPEKFMSNTTKLCKNLEILRESLGESVKIISGYRSPAYNKSVDGAKNSYHMTASAADIQASTKSTKQVYDTILSLISEGKIVNGGVGLYETWVHYDIGPTRRWKG